MALMPFMWIQPAAGRVALSKKAEIPRLANSFFFCFFLCTVSEYAYYKSNK